MLFPLTNDDQDTNPEKLINKFVVVEKNGSIYIRPIEDPQFTTEVICFPDESSRDQVEEQKPVYCVPFSFEVSYYLVVPISTDQLTLLEITLDDMDQLHQAAAYYQYYLSKKKEQKTSLANGF